MERRRNLLPTTEERLVSGELFIAHFGGGGSSLLLKLFDTVDGPIYGVLQSAEFSEGMTWYAGQVGRALTYGTSWLLDEFSSPETVATSSFRRDPSHHLFLDADGAIVWRFSGDRNGWRMPIDYSIGEAKERRLSDTAAPIPSFRIWECREDYMSQRAVPIFAYGNSEATARQQ